MGYATDALVPARGGLSGDPVVLGNLDLLLHLNLEAALGLRGTSLQLHVQSSQGGSASSRVGDLQGISSLEAPREWRLYEAWIEQRVLAPRLSLLAGVYDINGEFDVIPAAGDFLNSSFGFGPEYSLSGPAGPSTYPATSLGVRIKGQPTPSLYWMLGASDAAPHRPWSSRLSGDFWEGALLSFEGGYRRFQSMLLPAADMALQPEPRGRGRGRVDRPGQRRQRGRIGRGTLIEEMSTKVAVGGWAYTRELDPWAPGEPPARSWGAYVLGEQLLHGRGDGRGALSAFARVGTAAEGVNRIDLSLLGGLAFGGPFSARPDDVAGLGIAYARNGSPFLREQRKKGIDLERAETVMELTYRAQLGRFFVLQPNLQWVMSPGMDPAVSDALVLGLRAHVHLQLP
jgi:porin